MMNAENQQHGVIIDCINKIQNLCNRLDEIIDKNKTKENGKVPNKEEKCRKKKSP